jgi:four helix bundle protein
MENYKIRTFENLECWKACREVRNRFSMLIKTLPNQERNALADGIRRASRSITENIAEGFGRFHYQENIQFCRISRGSLFELLDQLITAQDEKYIKKEEFGEIRQMILHAIKILNGYINYLKNAKLGNTKNYENKVHDDIPEYGAQVIDDFPPNKPE